MKKSSSTRGRILGVVWLGVLSFLVLAMPGRCEQLLVTAGMKAQTTYDDNVHFQDKEDLEHKLVPSIKAEYGLENWNVHAGATLDLYRYDTLDELDHEDLTLNVGGEYNPTERLGMGLETTYRKDHTFASVLEESGDIGDFVLRETFSATPSLQWTPTEKDMVRLTIPVSFTEYGNPEYPDTEVYGSNVYWSHLLDDERTSILAYADYTNRWFDTANGEISQDVYMLMGGLGYSLTEVLSIQAMVGAGYMESSLVRTGFEDKDEDETFLSFNLSATYTWDRWTFTLSGDREQSPNTSGDSNLRTRVQFNGRYQFTERFTGSLGLAAYENITKGTDTETERFTYYVQPDFSYRLTEDFTLRLQYKYFDTENRTDNTQGQQNRLMLGIDYSYSDLF